MRWNQEWRVRLCATIQVFERTACIHMLDAEALAEALAEAIRRTFCSSECWCRAAHADMFATICHDRTSWLLLASNG